jgi:hypothetical protein
MYHSKKTIMILLICGVLLAQNISVVSAVSQATNTPVGSIVPAACPVIYDGQNGWLIEMCTTDPAVTTLMEILVDGVSKGNAALVRIYHQSQSGTMPQVAVVYASGYIRLKQNADPAPSIPFGTSFVLGPAYWTDVSTYHHNPQLNRLEVDTTWLPTAPLRMKAQGTNHDFTVAYEMMLPPPSDSLTRLHVTQTYTATAGITIDSTRRAEHQGFKLVQASSMFINEGGPCDGGYADCHDSSGARFIGNDLARQQTAFTRITIPGFIFTNPVPLGSTWLDMLHTDDQSWQSSTGADTSGNTPNVRIVLDDLPANYTITPQGLIGATTDPNDDNVSLWLHDDGPVSSSWRAGQIGQTGYWLLAQDDPPEPWVEMDLRTGLTFLDFEGSDNCFPVRDVAQSTTAELAAVDGYTDHALQLSYALGSSSGNWAQVRCNFNPPLNLSAYDHLRFDWRGDPATANSLEVGLINPATGGENIFARGYHHPTQHAWWGQMVVPFSFLHAWTTGTYFDPSKVSAIFISVVKDPQDDTGGSGRIAIDNLNAYNVGSRLPPSAFETVTPNPVAADAAVQWLASQRQSKDLLKSWKEEESCVAHTYDQALALLVFVDQGRWTEADSLVKALIMTQNSDGSWFKSRDCSTLAALDDNRWEGDIAWAIYALGRYVEFGGTNPQAVAALQKGADWLAAQINPKDGCLYRDHTEATIDAWLAFHAAGANYMSDADQIKNCLLTYYWDGNMGRFKGGRDWWQPYLDNQTWGAAFLEAVGETQKARQALSYAQSVLRTPAQGGQIFSYDGQAGPWSVWNEGAAQYIASGGSGANDLLSELLAQQDRDGAMVGSPDAFSGGGVWTTRWHGVAPTAWLYNALCGGLFHPGSHCNIGEPVGISVGKMTPWNYRIGPSSSLRLRYPNTNAGPAKVISTDDAPMIASQRVIYSGGSYSEMMGLPFEQLSKEYLFPYYNNVAMDSQLRVSNLGGTITTITVYLATTQIDQYTLAAGGATRKNYTGKNSGPLRVTSSASNILATVRVLYNKNSYSELMGLPVEQLAKEYIFPYYNNVAMDSQLRVSNVGGSSTTIKVYLGSSSTPIDSYTLAAGGATRKNYTGKNSGPLRVTSSASNILTTVRVLYGTGSYSELMGFPAGHLAQSYWYPVYDNVAVDSQLRVSNVGSATTHITVYAGGIQIDSYDLGKGAATRKNYPRNTGPLHVVSSTQPILTTVRTLYGGGSYYEMTGLPESQLSTQYFFPWYNNTAMSTELRIAIP